ncbi:MAG TPA: hypothetical protein DEQ40_08445 [Oxalobacteraceae bacterium]|nr:hypothetical protein [Oxalobacteraceae bacterium]
MSNQPEVGTFDVGVYQLQTADPVQGGLGGVANSPLLNLANRTGYLKAHMDALEAGTFIPAPVAPLASPTFTGTVSGPTPAAGDNSTKFATTAFVQFLNNGVASITGLTNANVTLSAAQYGAGIIALSGTLTGNINIVFPVGGKWIVVNNTTGAFSITCKTAAGAGIVIAQGKSRLLNADGTNIVISDTDFNTIAITGNSTAVTQSAGDNSTNIATTAFVKSLASGSFGSGTAGYAKIPGGLIIQWMPWSISPSATTNTPAGTMWGVASLTLPIAFPNAVLGDFVMGHNLTNGQFGCYTTSGVFGTALNVYFTSNTIGGSGPYTGFAFAIGY